MVIPSKGGPKDVAMPTGFWEGSKSGRSSGESGCSRQMEELVW